MTVYTFFANLEDKCAGNAMFLVVDNDDNGRFGDGDQIFIDKNENGMIDCVETEVQVDSDEFKEFIEMLGLRGISQLKSLLLVELEKCNSKLRELSKRKEDPYKTILSVEGACSIYNSFYALSLAVSLEEGPEIAFSSSITKCALDAALKRAIRNVKHPEMCDNCLDVDYKWSILKYFEALGISTTHAAKFLTHAIGVDFMGTEFGIQRIKRKLEDDKNDRMIDKRFPLPFPPTFIPE
jgi:hypothetical protein